VGCQMDLTFHIQPAQEIAEIHKAHTIERESYSPQAAGSLEAFTERFQSFPNYFLLAYDANQLIGALNGVRLNHSDIANEELKRVSQIPHNGLHFCVLTVAVAEKKRRLGVGSALMQSLIKQARADKLHSINLMCEVKYIPFYEKLGFQYIQLSSSNHAGISWHELQMTL
jgi:GNAT superfamily N-acetyltransferase